MDKEILKVEHLRFAYSDTSVLKDVDFTLNKGDFLGIIGSNGAGKSTLIKIILGLIPYTHGKIIFSGAKIGYVPQKSNFFNSDFPATVKEVVMANLYNKAGFFKHYDKAGEKRLYDVLEMVGMSGFENKLIGKLSGGQQQRIFIARALICNPDIIFMDEPTVGVDAQSVKLIMNLISDLNKQGITIVMTNHDTPELVKVSNKLLIFCIHGNSEFVKTNSLTMNQINQIFAGKRHPKHE